LRELAEKILPENSQIENSVVEHDFSKIERKKMTIDARPDLSRQYRHGSYPAGVQRFHGQGKRDMKSDESDEARRSWLRKLAEQQVKSSSHSAQAIPKEDVLDLIHELEVHQLELQMQNEELRRSQSELEDSRKKYFDLYDLAPVGYVTLDRNGLIREINLTGAELLGRERARLKGNRFAAFVEKSGRDEVYKFCRRLFESGGREEVEITIMHSEKAPLDVLLSGVALQDPEGNLSLCQVAMTDISARKAAENWRRKLIETTQDAVIAIDRKAQVVLFNPAAEKMFGYAAEQVIGKKINLLMPLPYTSEHDRYIARYERTGERRAIGKIREVAGWRKNGEIFPIELSVTELDAKSEVRHIAFVRDISEKAELQAAVVEKARLASLNEIAAKAVHEIGNPLQSIAMTIELELLERRTAAAGNEGVATMLKSLENEVSRLKRLLYDFRTLSMRENYDLRPASLADIVQDLCSLESSKHISKGIRVEIEVEPGLPPVLADRDKIKQALLNLCKNAEEAMPEGGTLTIRGYESGGKVSLEVSDTGIGMPQNFTLFEPFKTTKASGTGLGLSIVQQIVSRHQGSLSYTSEPGKGTTFTLTFPAQGTKSLLLRVNDVSS
jgi:two-component system sensor kinase FixL